MKYFIMYLICVLSMLFVTEGVRIDRTRCFTDTNCFALESCFSSLSVGFREVTDRRWSSNTVQCPLTIEIKPYTSTKYLYLIEVDEPIALKDKPSVEIHMGGTPLFGCKQEAGNISLSDSAGYASKYGIEIYERTYFGTDYIHCAFTIAKLDDFDQHMIATFNTDKMKIKVFASENKVAKEFDADGTGAHLFVRQRLYEKCDPDELEELTGVDQSLHVEKIREKGRKEIDCTNIPVLQYELYFYKEGDEKEYKATKLECAPTTKKWKIVTETDAVDVIDARKFKFICGAPITRKCKTLCSDPDCPTFVEATKDADPSLKCPDDKWYIDHEYHVDVTTQCVKDFDKPNSALFMMTFTRSNTQDQLPISARCFKDYNCTKKSPLQLDDCKENDENDKLCNELQKETDSFSCKDEIPLMLSPFKYDPTPLITTAVKCDKATGVWRNSEGKEVPIGTYVKCKEKSREEEKEALTGSLIGIIARVVSKYQRNGKFAVIFFNPDAQFENELTTLTT